MKSLIRQGIATYSTIANKTNFLEYFHRWLFNGIGIQKIALVFCHNVCGNNLNNISTRPYQAIPTSSKYHYTHKRCIPDWYS
ncbi:MAG TPA: hypothetical protein ACQGQG_06925 [Xylella sp.]